MILLAMIKYFKSTMKELTKYLKDMDNKNEKTQKKM